MHAVVWGRTGCTCSGQAALSLTSPPRYKLELDYVQATCQDPTASKTPSAQPRSFIIIILGGNLNQRSFDSGRHGRQNTHKQNF